MSNKSFARISFTGLLMSILLSFSQLALSADTEDPYLEGFEKYAQENPALATSVDAYTQELKKVMQQEPKLDESTKQPVK